MILYLAKDIFLQKLDNWIVFVDGDDSEQVHPEDLLYISKAFGIELEVLEDFYYN